MDRLSIFARLRKAFSVPVWTQEDQRQYNWLIYKGEKALQALNESPPDIERASAILRMEL